MWLPLVFVLYALFALVFVISKFGLEYTSPLFLVGSRMVVAGIIMLAYLYFFKRETFRLTKSNLVALLALALFNIYLTNICEFWGLQYLTAAKTCFLYSLSPFLSALFAYFILAEVMTARKWIGLAIGFIGTLPILLQQSGTEEMVGGFLFISWAELSVLGAVVFSVYGWILLKKLCAEQQQSPLMANGMSMLVGGMMALINSYFVEEWNPVPVTEWAPFLTASLLLVLFSNLICYNLYGVLLRRYSAAFMSFAGFTTPIFTALFGWLFLGETTSWHLFASLSVIFTGLYIYHGDEARVRSPVSVQGIK